MRHLPDYRFMSHRHTTTRPSPFAARPGFTLVELLVAMALIVFMMLILSEAFTTGLDTFRRSKAVGDMNAKLRTAATLLRRDLQADHFEGRRKLSDASFSTLGPPREGFFRIWQGSTVRVTTPAPAQTIAGIFEGNDANAISQIRATDHMLHFTVKLRGNDRQDFFAAKVPPGSPLMAVGRADNRYQDAPETFTSQWAEVVYFLRPNGNFAGSTPLFGLYRRQLLLVPNNQEVNWGSTSQVPAAERNQYLEISCKPNPQEPGRLYFNSPIDITVPQRRFGVDASKTFDAGAGQYPGMPLVRPDPNDSRTWTYRTLGEENPALEGDDLLLPDVISFEVQVSTGGDFTSTNNLVLAASTTNNLFEDYAGTTTVPARPTPRAFDTWTTVVDGYYEEYGKWNESGTVTNRRSYRRPISSSIKALRVTLRVWDVKTQQARQMTIIQDM